MEYKRGNRYFGDYTPMKLSEFCLLEEIAIKAATEGGPTVSPSDFPLDSIIDADDSWDSPIGRLNCAVDKHCGSDDETYFNLMARFRALVVASRNLGSLASWKKSPEDRQLQRHREGKELGWFNRSL